MDPATWLLVIVFGTSHYNGSALTSFKHEYKSHEECLSAAAYVAERKGDGIFTRSAFCMPATFR